MVGTVMLRPAWTCLVAGALLLAAPAAARQPRTVTLRFPRFALPAGTNSELCVFARIKTKKPFDLGSWEIRHKGAHGSMAVSHFLIYVYNGERLGEFATEAGRIVQSRGCLDLGPVDRDTRQLIAAGAGPRTAGALQRGVALRLAPVPLEPGGEPQGIGVLFSANWVNGDTRTRFGSSKVVLHRAARKKVRRIAVPIAERTAELGLAVAPGQVRSTEASTAVRGASPDTWAPAGDACVLAITGHMHGRGRFLGVDRLDAQGMAQNPPDGQENRYEPGRRHLFAATDYTDPGVLRPPKPILLRAGEALHYACWHDNGATTAVRLGCEESAGTPPGVAAGLPGGGPAKPCTIARPVSPECPAADPAYPGRTFTGKCVAANLVAGSTPDDETCALTGAYFDAVAGAPAGSECDATEAPVLQ